MTRFVHFDEALLAAREHVIAAHRAASDARVLIITDIFGRLRLVVWSDAYTVQ